MPQGEVPGSGVQVFEKCAIRYCRPVEILVDEEEEGTEEFLVSIEVYNHNGNMPPVEVLDGYSRAIIKIQPEPEPTPTPTSSPSPSPSPRPEPKSEYQHLHLLRMRLLLYSSLYFSYMSLIILHSSV